MFYNNVKDICFYRRRERWLTMNKNGICALVSDLYHLQGESALPASADVVPDLVFEPDPRPYTGVYDYCIQCGACAVRCPVGAIDPVKGKDHILCSQCLDRSRELFRPRYGCGLCQTGVPCEDRNPSE